jgi:hypothetical protein
MKVTPSIEDIQRKFEALRAGMNEAVRRRWAATEARALGRGVIGLVANATGLSRYYSSRWEDVMGHPLLSQ